MPSHPGSVLDAGEQDKDQIDTIPILGRLYSSSGR